MSNLIVETMHGMGDNIYAREVVRSLLPRWGDRLFVRTAWPQMFWDLDVELLRPNTELRTQRRNVEEYRDWGHIPDGPYQRLHLHYDTRDWMAGRSIPEALLHNANVSRSGDFSFHPRDEWVDQVRRVRPKGPFAIVHPSTSRTEWRNVARAPRPEYLQQLVHQHTEFEWWEITDLVPGVEELIGPPLQGVKSVGGFSTEQLIALVSLADVVVTGPGFMLPLAISLRVPTVCLFGGDLPNDLLVEQWMVGAPYQAVEPVPFCDCGAKGSRHTGVNDCNKTIDPNWIERAFTIAACKPLLKWDDGYGHYPVNVDGQYNESYYENYAKLACTPMGHEITDHRVSFTRRHFGDCGWVDVGPGACQFVEASHAHGFDINPKTNEHLRRIGRYVDPTTQSSFQVLTFWDSLEHIPGAILESLLRRVTHGCVVSMPIYHDRDHALKSRHFKPAEHMHYFTEERFLRFMKEHGLNLINKTDFETRLGRDEVYTYAFEKVSQ